MKSIIFSLLVKRTVRTPWPRHSSDEICWND